MPQFSGESKPQSGYILLDTWQKNVLLIQWNIFFCIHGTFTLSRWVTSVYHLLDKNIGHLLLSLWDKSFFNRSSSTRSTSTRYAVRRSFTFGSLWWLSGSGGPKIGASRPRSGGGFSTLLHTENLPCHRGYLGWNTTAYQKKTLDSGPKWAAQIEKRHHEGFVAKLQIWGDSSTF